MIHVLCRHGAPERIISDRGTQLTSDIFRDVTDLLGMKQSMTSGYHPQADGQAERTIGTLIRTLSKMVGTNQQEWDLLIPYALWAYRTAVHATTKETPFFLVYGRQPINPADFRIRQWMEEHRDVSEYTKETAQRLIDAQERVIQAVNKAKAYDKGRFDADKVDSTFKVGEIVWFEQEKVPGDQNRKLAAKYIGPYKITKVENKSHDLNVQITHTNNPNDVRYPNIRKLKRAILRPEDVELIPKEAENMIAQESKAKATKRASNTNKLNPRGRTTRTQAIRAGYTRRVVHEDGKEYEVEGIIGEHRDEETGETHYLVKWKGYTTGQSTWQPVKDFKNAPDVLREWNTKQKNKKAMRAKMEEVVQDSTTSATQKDEAIKKTARERH